MQKISIIPQIQFKLSYNILCKNIITLLTIFLIFVLYSLMKYSMKIGRIENILKVNVPFKTNFDLSSNYGEISFLQSNKD